jgi:pilus assembly protein CpaB
MDISKMRGLLQSNLVLGAVALAAGALAAWLGARQLNQRTADLEHEASLRYSPAPFIVASRNVPKGQRIDATHLSIRSMPRAYAPTDALSPDDASLLIGGRAAIEIRRGTPVVRAAVLAEASREKLSEQLPAGLRALTIQVDQLNSISGRLEAGDAIDLFYSRTRGNGAVLMPLLQRVHVLATGDLTQMQILSRPEDQPGDFSTVTLLVSAAEAQRIVLAEQTGRLTLLLRRPNDEEHLDVRALDSAALLRPPRIQGAPTAQRLLSVELLVGGQGGAPARTWLVPGAALSASNGDDT